MHINLAGIFTRLPLKIMPAGDVFRQKNDEIFKDVPNVFAIADFILVVCYDVNGRDHDTTLK